MDVEAIREELLHGASRSMRRRRRIIALAALGAVDSAFITLHQTGALKRLPDLPGREIFDANRVTSSLIAYETGFPDAAAGLSFYGLVMILASAKGDRTSGRGALMRWGLTGVALAGAGVVGRYLHAMLFKEHRACIYCLGAAAMNAGILALSAADLFDPDNRR
ncbi:MAG TPA: vitamin K epoxide reductase family protein [Candidatus Binataceae bacterium]|nr:vitamin K epoxide reductase family protein [Candidatus Binataceae bacterium]